MSRGGDGRNIGDVYIVAMGQIVSFGLLILALSFEVFG